MKILIILALMWNSLSTTPYTFKEGTPRTEIINCCPDYHFMFHKTIQQGKPFPAMTIGMIGYWENGKGCVLHFTNDTLSYRMEFTDAKLYKKYITNPRETKNIMLNPKNFR